MRKRLTWKDHLNGQTWREDDENAPGRIPQVSQRVGICKMLSKLVFRERLKLFSQRIFYAKLNYCLPVFG